MKRIPVVIVAGFLGAGKTTMLNHLLRTRSGLRIGVVVNDFGAVNIDAMLVAGQVDGAVSLGNGCMCCTVDDDGLDATFASLVTRRAGLDLIVVEASGLAEPRNLIRMVAGSDNPRIEYGGLLYLVDARNYAETRQQHPRIDQHIALADLVVLNKTDLTGADEVEHARTLIREANAGAPIITTRDAVVDLALLADLESAQRDDDGAPRQLGLDELLADDDHCGHLHHDYQSVSFVEPGAMNPRALAAFLEQPPTGVFRVKGFVHFEVARHRRKYVVHSVGSYVSVHTRPWDPQESRRTELVVIGAGIDEAQVRAALEKARADDAVDAQSMLSITRYVR
ncbi:MAG: GTP-binding protein [Gordonia sp.]|uniref:GTP-binding protein n=1 Tax=Gordonia rubripertincta TaxID=36822 RepID=A0ABT4MP50_GORRU|nr:GTP-binding protein [Gordonia rubripertincta]MBA4024229.1 GTP-binding protein [Gordonia sp. (in: high G+C Gram-positive bacteria)]MCZ4548455.1 GTP-binding protein [Gordonia rubripertincta]